MSKKRRGPRREDERAAPSVQTLRAGPGPTITTGGKTWRLGFNTQDAKAALEACIVSHQTREAVKRMRLVGGQEGMAYFDLFQSRVDTGTYNTFAPGWLHTMAGADASWLFLQSLLMESHPHVTAEDAKHLLATEPEQVQIAVGVVAPDFFEAAVRQVGVAGPATPDQVRAAAQRLAAAVVSKFAPAPSTEPTPAPIAEPGTA